MKRYLAKGMKAISYTLVFFAVQFAWVGSSHAQIVALGASVVEGYGVGSGQAFPQQLEAMLHAKGNIPSAIKASSETLRQAYWPGWTAPCRRARASSYC
jgi:lysophospholipase L1-like esterase